MAAANKYFLKGSGETAAQLAIEMTEESASKAPDQLREKGMKVHIHTDSEIAAMKGQMGPAFDKAFADATGADGKKLLDIISKM